jgi:hypothetical protein
LATFLAARHRTELCDSDRDTAVNLAIARLAAEQSGEKKRKGFGEPYYGGGRKGEEVVPGREGVDLLEGIVTRNHYGSLVLNAAHTLFIDVDVEAPRYEECSQPWIAILEDLQTVLANEKGRGFRIYRTAAGFRVLATTCPFEPASKESNRLMNIVGADYAFIDLCKIQNSFRARLTPKPWRCGARRPPNQYPRTSIDEQRCFNQWLAKYDEACRDHATCQYLGHVGSDDVHKRVRPIIELHDRETKAFASLPLA